MALLEEPFFSAQIGLALATSAAGIDTPQLGHAYNCANDDRLFAAGLRCENEIKIIHYLRTTNSTGARSCVSPRNCAVS